MKLPTVLQREWCDSPVTQRVADHARKELINIHVRLLQTCRGSEDAQVRAAMERYDSASDFCKLLEGKSDEKRDE